MDDLEVFLTNVVTTAEGWLQLLVGPPFTEEFYKWPEQREDILKRIRSVNDTNVYFSPHLFSEKNSHKDFVLPSRTIVVDLDNADITDLRMNASFLVETSPGRHQGYWILKQEIPDFETVSKQLTYTIENADHSGWPLGHKFRLPGRKNFKYDPHPTTKMVVALSSERIYTTEEIKEWVGETNVSTTEHEVDDNWINNPPTEAPGGKGPLELLEPYKIAIGPKAFSYFKERQPVRHEALWGLMLALFRAGATRDEVFWIAKHSANNKFEQDQHYSADRDLAKDVDRTKRADTTDRTDITQLVFVAERAQGTANDKKRMVSRIVIADMLRRGEFIYTDDGRYWYLNANAGRPIQIGKRSEQLDSLLDMTYGLNSADGFAPYVSNHLVNYTVSKGRRAKNAVLSSFDGESLFLHSGKADVYKITSTGVLRHPDGQYGVLFPWRSPAEEVITLNHDPLPGNVSWVDCLFEGWFDNLLDLTPAQAKVLIRVWVLFTLFRDIAVSRPILTLLGEPGSGKSTLFRMIYVLLYGRMKSLSAISSPDDFDFLAASDPVVVFDNVDSWTGWLPDRLALAAAASDLTKRKLYTDSDTVTLKRQAILGITAHDPRFGRADVVDRMIILNFQRRQNFLPESQMIERISALRPRLWGSIVKDVQAVLSTPDVAPEDIPEFRISDFARIGARIAKALNLSTEFAGIIETLRRTQTAFTLSEEDVLVSAIKTWHMRRNGNTPDFCSVGYLFEQFSAVDTTFERTIKSSGILARKLRTLQANLKNIFQVEFEYDTIRGTHMWKIDPIGLAPKGPDHGV